jgi:hypothetical protein
MWPSPRDGAIMMSLVLCVGLAAAQTGGRDPNGANASLIDETTGSLARFQAEWAPVSRVQPSSGSGKRAALPLSDEQNSRIHESVLRNPDEPLAVAPAPDVGEALPGSVSLQDLPRAVTEEIPLVQGHQFVKLDDRILVVDPSSRTVVAMIPRYRLLQ